MAVEVFRLLLSGEVVLPSDEFIDDDCVHWLPAEQWTIGRAWHNGIKPMRRGVTTPLALLLPVVAYALPDGAVIERCEQRDGSFKWAVRRSGGCLNTDGEFEFEPMPSSRDAEFLTRCRYDSAESAYAVWKRHS